MTTVDPQVGKDFIEHFGTKGMRWGVRKERTDYGHGKSKGEKKDGKKGAETKPKRVVGKTTTQGKDISKLSDAQLQKVISRMNMEQQYARLNDPGPSRKRRAAKATTKFVMEAGRGILMSQVKAAGNERLNLVRDNLGAKNAAAKVAKSMAKKMATQGGSFT